MGFTMPSGLHRTYGAHHLHFITCSCYRRLPWLKRARSRDRFLAIFEQTRRRYSFVVVGYVVMPEPIHLLLPNRRKVPIDRNAGFGTAHGESVIAIAKAERPAPAGTVPCGYGTLQAIPCVFAIRKLRYEADDCP